VDCPNILEVNDVSRSKCYKKGFTRMSIKNICVLPLLATVLSACSVLPGSQSAEPVETELYKDIGTLVESEFADTVFFQVKNGELKSGFLPHNEENFYRPINALNAFCSQEAGTLTQIERGFVESYNTNIFVENTGLFACWKMDRIDWMVRINMTNPNYSNPDVRALRIKNINPKEYFDQIEKRKMLIEEELKRKENIKTVFENFRIQPKAIGQTVCNWDNYLGFVEAVSDTKIKVLVRAKANVFEKGAFFDRTVTTLSTRNINEALWSDKDDWAECFYDIPLR